MSTPIEVQFALTFEPTKRDDPDNKGTTNLQQPPIIRPDLESPPVIHVPAGTSPRIDVRIRFVEAKNAGKPSKAPRTPKTPSTSTSQKRARP